MPILGYPSESISKIWNWIIYYNMNRRLWLETICIREVHLNSTPPSPIFINSPRGASRSYKVDQIWRGVIS